MEMKKGEGQDKSEKGEQAQEISKNKAMRLLNPT